jgi:hypothetical protein
MMAFCFRIYGGVEHITDSILGREKNLSSELEFKLIFVTQTNMNKNHTSYYSYCLFELGCVFLVSLFILGEIYLS